MPERWKASSTFRRLAIFLILVSELVLASSWRRVSISLLMSMRAQQFAHRFGAHQRSKSSPYSSSLSR